MSFLTGSLDMISDMISDMKEVAVSYPSTRIAAKWKAGNDGHIVRW